MLYVMPTTAGLWTSDRPSGPWTRRDADWNRIFVEAEPTTYLGASTALGEPLDAPDGAPISFAADQEVWAAGVTYFKSRTARMEESKDAGGGTFYDMVYEAERPELFFKGNARTTVAAGEPVRIRKDSNWNVPEPELVLAIGSSGRIIGFTSGNDMSSRDIEGANPLYLPQAKVYDSSCTLGPVLALTDEPIDRSMTVRVVIGREDATAFEGSTTLEELKRSPEELAGYLFRDQRFPSGVFLMTGTGVVPGDGFTLAPGDTVSVTIGELPTLTNTVTQE